jgi:hypothetical protein
MPHCGKSLLLTNLLCSDPWLGSRLVPNAAVIGFLIDPRPPESAPMLSDAQAAARTLGRELLVLNASTPSEIDAAFATLRQRRVGALLVGFTYVLFQPAPTDRRAGSVTRSLPCIASANMSKMVG